MLKYILAALSAMQFSEGQVQTDHASLSEYNRVAKDYEKGRPDYPQEILPIFTNALDLGPGKTVLDLAAGTGKLTKALQLTGMTLLAVEPASEMRTVFAEQFPDIPIFDGRAEAIPLPSNSVDAIVVGTAFHWFDGEKALAEIARVVKPGGGLGLIWNIFDDEIDWVRQIRLLLDKNKKHNRHDSLEWRTAFEKTPLFGPLSHDLTYRYTRPGTAQDVLAFLSSMKILGTLSEVEQEAIIEKTLAILASHPDTKGKKVLDIPYRIEIYSCRRKNQ